MSRNMIVSLIGRPNVGKSSLFNVLMRGKDKVITHDMPGVTRDRYYGFAKLDELPNEKSVELVLVDTGGFYPESSKSQDGGLSKTMTEQAKIAILESDLILLLVDVREGLSPFDQSIVQYIRAKHKSLWLIVNKCDTPKQDASVGEFFTLGVDGEKIFALSCAHGRGVLDLRERLQRHACEFAGHSDDSEESLLQNGVGPAGQLVSRLAIVGAPNAGKSTLLNHLVGAERSLVSDVPGTTVDPVEGHFELYLGGDLQTVCVVDTAGIRRKSAVAGYVEAQSVYRSLRAITDSDTVVYLVDAEKGITHQDKRLIDIALEKGKAVIICVNKVDIIEFATEKDRQVWVADFKRKIPWLYFCDLVPISALQGRGIKRLKRTIAKTIQIRRNSLATSAVNRELMSLVERNPVIVKGSGGSHLKVKYSFQVKSEPPTFLIYSNKTRGIPDNYKRYLKNGLRSKFGLDNMPIHLIFRSGRSYELPSTESTG